MPFPRAKLPECSQEKGCSYSNISSRETPPEMSTTKLLIESYGKKNFSELARDGLRTIVLNEG